MTGHRLLEELHNAWKSGRAVAAVNVNTEVRRAYLQALRSSLTSSDSDDLIRHFGAARAAAPDVVRSKVRLFSTTRLRETEAFR